MNEILGIINEMSPYLLLGFLFAGILHVFVPGAVYNRYLSGNSFRSVFYATLLGIPLPLCSCGVLPTAIGLRKEGASKGATVSFLIATPETGVDSIVATYSLMGLPFAIVRPITALCTSLFAGSLVNWFDKGSTQDEDSSEDIEEEHDCCHEDHDGDCCHGGKRREGVTGKIIEVLDYGFVHMMGDIGKWLIVGLIVAGLITVFVPDSFFDIFKGHTALSMLLVLCIAIPMYICATGSIPIAVALIMKGLSPGAALVLLMAGPACNVASILVIGKRLGRKTLFLYLMSIIIGAATAGFIIDGMPAEWFMPTLMNANGCCEDHSSWFNWLCTAILALLLLNALVIKPLRHGQGHSHGNDNDCECKAEKGDDKPQQQEEGHCCCCHKG